MDGWSVKGARESREAQEFDSAEIGREMEVARFVNDDQISHRTERAVIVADVEVALSFG